MAGQFDLSDRQRYREKLQRCLTGLERLLAEKRFDRPKNLMGLEIELNLVGADGMPKMLNAQVLERIASRDFQTELAMFNLEVNIAPHRLGGRVFDRLAEEIRTSLAYADRKAGEVDAGIAMIGILPTLDRDDLVSSNLSAVDRYALLNEQIVAARGEDFTLDIEGVERLTCTSKSIAPRPPAPRCSCTSRSPRTASPTCGTRPRRSPPRRSPSAPTRPSCSAASCGGSRGPRCSSSPPTRARPNSRPRASGRAPGSASGG